MKKSIVGLLAAIAVGMGTFAAQSQSDSETLKLLRQTIADQKRNPDKVIRNYTNLPPAEVTNAAPAREATPAREAAPQAVAQSKRPAESKPAPPPAIAPADKKAAAAELERQFLNGKLSARQYQKALAELDNASKAAPAQPAVVSKQAPPQPGNPPNPGVPAQAPPTPAQAPPTTAQATANQKRVSEVEARIDEMIRQKEARENAAKTNSTPTPAPGVKSSKRERLDFLLRQVVEGKLSDAEYKKEREKILAEPE